MPHSAEEGVRADEPGSGRVSGARINESPRWPLAPLASAARADEPGSGRVSGARINESPRWPLAPLASAVRADEPGSGRVSSARSRASSDALCEHTMESPLRLVCVPPDRAAAIWPHVRALIHAAMRRGDLSSFRPVEASVLAGDALLWLAWDGMRIQAAAVTELHATEWRKVCVIVACGGAGVDRWIG